MNNFCRTTKFIDVVICLDISKRMLPFVNEFKKNMVNFYDDFSKEAENYGSYFDNLRVKFIIFDNNRKPVSTKFFDLPEDNNKFCEFINNITINNTIINNSDIINNNSIINALESLSLALNSKWDTDSSIRRHVILLFSDASIDSSDYYFLADQKEDLKEIASHHIDNLYKLWDGESHIMDHKSKRLLSFLPADIIWNRFDNFSNYYCTYLDKSCGLEDVDIKSVIAILVNSI